MESTRPGIKICGITREEEAEMLNEAGVTHAGFVFYEKSKRYIEMTKTKDIFKKLNKDIRKVAVTVDPDSALLAQIEEAGFDVLQVHKRLRPEVLQKTSLPIWYAINLSPKEAENDVAWKEAERLAQEAKVKAFVVDAAGYGSGKMFDWHAWDETRWRSLRKDKQFVLAGGLTPENVQEGIRIFNPDIVDVSSGVEGTDGKSREKILQFVSKVKNN